MEIKDNSSPDPSSVRATMESEKEGRDGDIIYCRAPREGIGESIRGNGIFGIAPEREWRGRGVKGGDFWLSLPKSIGGEMSGGGMACCCVWLSKAETVPPCFSLRTGENLDDNFYSSSLTFWGREEISIHFVRVPFLSSHVVFGAEKGERGRGNTEIDVLNIIFLRRRASSCSPPKKYWASCSLSHHRRQKRSKRTTEKGRKGPKKPHTSLFAHSLLASLTTLPYLLSAAAGKPRLSYRNMQKGSFFHFSVSKGEVRLGWPLSAIEKRHLRSCGRRGRPVIKPELLPLFATHREIFAHPPPASCVLQEVIYPPPLHVRFKRLPASNERDGAAAAASYMVECFIPPPLPHHPENGL